MAFKKNKKKERTLSEKSSIVKGLMNLSNLFYSKAENSMAGRIFTSYNSHAEESGLFGLIKKKLNLGKRVFRPLKRNVSKQISQSFFLEKISCYLKRFLNTKINVYGLFFVTAGVGSLLAMLAKNYLRNNVGLLFVDLFAVSLMFLLSLPMLFSSSTLAEAILDSRIACSILFDFLGVKKGAFEKTISKPGHDRSLFPLGLAFCIISWWVRPIVIIGVLMLACLALSVFYTPEIGVVSLLTAIPFLSAGQLKKSVIFVFVCFFLKYIRGKRTLKFDALNITVFLFSCLIVVNCLTSFLFEVSRTYTFEMILSIGAFFLVVNLIKSKVWMKRCIKAIICSCFLVCADGILKYILSRLSSGYVSQYFISEKNIKMISSFESVLSFAGYLILVLPPVIAGLFMSGNKGKSFLFVFIPLSVSCIVLTSMYSVGFSIIFGLLFFMLIYGKKTFAALLFGGITVPFALFYIPPALSEKMMLGKRAAGILTDYSEKLTELFKSRVFGFFNGTGLGTFSMYYSNDETYGIGYRFCVELGIVGFFMFCLIVVLCLQKNITFFSKGCTKQGRLMSTSTMVGIFSICAFGLGRNIFADYKLNTMFWLILGLSATVSHIECDCTYDIPDDCLHVE